jgi:hypothetical protein
VIPMEATEALEEIGRAEAMVRGLREDFDRDLIAARQAMDAVKAAGTERRAELAQQAADLSEREAAFAALVRNRAGGLEYVANAWADYELARAEAQATALEHKARPALIAAQTVRDKGRELAEMRRRAKRAEWLAAFYEWHVPWLSDLRDVEEEEAFVASSEDDQETSDDPVRGWLSDREYAALPEAERNQRALDRYLRAPKTSWQIGRDYERYVGYLQEQEGATVTYQGIIAGFDDLGRDVIARRGDEVRIIQCKRWAAHKTIHEKHIFQLFGTVVAARINEPHLSITAEFVTTTQLSDRARAFASQLGVSVRESFPLADYPRIKCNIALTTDERVYHLPFDQQYDSTVVTPQRGERYTATVAEAEGFGFRRAHRWRRTPGDS